MSYFSFNSYRDNSTKRVRGLKMSVLIMRENMLFYEEIYTAGKNVTLPPAVLAVTKLTSVSKFLANVHSFALLPQP